MRTLIFTFALAGAALVFVSSSMAASQHHTTSVVRMTLAVKPT